MFMFNIKLLFLESVRSVADPGGACPPPGPVKIGHKKDGHRRRPHRFHVSRPPPTRPLDPLLEIIITYVTKNKEFGACKESLQRVISFCCIFCVVNWK